jgi:DNA mismatch repair protein MutS2
MEKLVREIREQQNLEMAKLMAEKVRQEREEAEQAVIQLEEQIYNEAPLSQFKKAKTGELQIGDLVRMKSGGSSGIIEAIDKTKAIVQMGPMRLTVKLRDIEHAREELNVQKQKSISVETLNQFNAFENKLDIRGLTPDEALRRVEEFMDRALMNASSELRIVHGRGTGALRNLVRNKVREYREVKQVFHPASNEGGDGVTVVEL